MTDPARDLADAMVQAVSIYCLADLPAEGQHYARQLALSIIGHAAEGDTNRRRIRDLLNIPPVAAYALHVETPLVDAAAAEEVAMTRAYRAGMTDQVIDRLRERCKANGTSFVESLDRLSAIWNGANATVFTTPKVSGSALRAMEVDFPSTSSSIVIEHSANVDPNPRQLVIDALRASTGAVIHESDRQVYLSVGRAAGKNALMDSSPAHAAEIINRAARRARDRRRD